MGIRDKARQWKEKRNAKIRDKMNQKVEQELPKNAGPQYSLIDEIKHTPYYKHSSTENDQRAREFLTEHLDIMISDKIVPGQLVMFNYFEPQTKEDLEYYDASPVTIYFNTINTNKGKRVLGFNIHYYPPKMRFHVMNTIFNIYKPIYTKYFKDGTDKSIEAFDYQYLINSLENAGLDFGVRMYIPNLITKAYQIPPQMWHVAVFTEGWFKKETRTAIMNYWQNWVRNKSGVKRRNKTR